MEQATFQLGATDIYRGQRNEDHHKAPIRDGHVENGVTYHFPLELWTRDEVKHYLQLECPELIPEYYVNEKTSRDCMDCTAYLKDNTSRIRHLPHKEYSIVRLVLNQWRMDVEDETRW
jgi:phosphoadenosine phosphosulfate reductase